MAAHRLMDALNNHGVKAKMLVRDKLSDNLSVVGLPKSPLLRWHFLWERLVIFFHLRFSRKHLFEIDIANAGTDITRLPEFKEADVIHLHWVNQGMLSLKDIQKILHSGKPVVWTMHDIWPATAICHLTLGCRHFTTQCRECQLLSGRSGLATSVWRRKQRMLADSNVYFVACSHWLASEAKASALLNGQKVTNIPNPIDTHIYKKTSQKEVRDRLGLPRDKRLLLFVSQRVTNPNKGMDYLIKACEMIRDIPNLGVVVLGGHAEEVAGLLPFETFPMDYVYDDRLIVDIYNAVDLFVLPSLSENLPNTIMEAMACGVPCVGFHVGGIPEEIDHKKTGYVANYRDAEDLARGIRWVLEADAEALGEQCQSKVLRNYSQSAVAMRYTEVYNQALAMKHYKL